MNKDVIKFLKIREVKSPTRAYQYDAGIDFYVPQFNKSFIEDLKKKNPDVFKVNTGYNTASLIYTTTIPSLTLNGSSNQNVSYELNDTNNSIFKFDDDNGENYFLLYPHSRIMIPSGIKSRMANPGRALIATNKSGIATKHGLVVGATTVDYTYMGEIHLSVINTSTKPVRIYENMKIVQFIETPVFNSKIDVLDSSGSDEKGLEEISKGFYKGLEDDRKDRGFGSSDKK